MRAPIDSLALSNAIRPGLVGWMKTLAREVAPKEITVNTIAPGRIDTERLRALGGRHADTSRRPARRARRDRRSRLLPRLRPRGLRHRRGDPGRRRPHAQPALTPRLSPGRLLGAGAVLLARDRAFLWIWPSHEFLLLPDKARPVAPLVQVKGRQGPDRPGQHLLRRDHHPPRQAVRAALPLDPQRRHARPRELVNPPGSTTPSARRRTCARWRARRTSPPRSP